MRLRTDQILRLLATSRLMPGQAVDVEVKTIANEDTICVVSPPYPSDHTKERPLLIGKRTGHGPQNLRHALEGYAEKRLSAAEHDILHDVASMLSEVEKLSYDLTAAQHTIEELQALHVEAPTEEQPLLNTPIAFEWKEVHDSPFQFANGQPQQADWGIVRLHVGMKNGATTWWLSWLGVCTETWSGHEKGISIEEAKQRAEALAITWLQTLANAIGFQIVPTLEVQE